MALFFQVLGIFFFLLIAAVVIAILVIRAKVKRFIKEVTSSIGEATAMPETIKLNRQTAPAWEDEDTVRAYLAPLPRLGFEPVGSFRVDELGGLQLEAHVNPRESVYAVVYEHAEHGIVWLDLYTKYQDGGSFTCTTTNRAGLLDKPEGWQTVSYPGLGTLELWERLRDERPKDRPMKAVDVSTFVNDFEEAYAAEMRWRSERGGPTFRELQAIAALDGGGEFADPTEEIIQAFLRESDMPASRWEKLRDRVVVVHERMDSDEVVDLISSYAEDEIDSPDDEDGFEPRSAFADLNAKLPKEARYEKVGSVSEPVAADLYVAPQ